MKSIEVIVPTYNRIKDMTRFLDSIPKLSLKPDIITIVDAGASSVDYKSYEAEFLSINVKLNIVRSKPGLTIQRNVGIINSTCDHVLFSDDDVVFHDDFFKEAIKVFESDKKHEIGGLTGNLENFEFKMSRLSKLFRKMFYLPVEKGGNILKSGLANPIDYSTQTSGEISWVNGCNMFFRKEVFNFFLFDENLKRYCIEDLDFSIRISKKYKLFYCASAKYSHFPSPFSRINVKEKYLMLVRNYHYLFNKNIRPTCSSSIPHYISLFGIVFQALFLQRSIPCFRGAFQGLWEILFLKNYTVPNYQERIDNSAPSKIQLAEHECRYEFAATYCEGKYIMDCACGEGIGLNIMSKKAKEIIGVDIDKDTLAAAQKKNIDNKNIKYENASVLNLPFGNDHFETVTCIETLEHIPEKFQKNAIIELHRVLKKGGTLVLTTPNKDITSPGMIAPKNYFHIHELSINECKNLFDGLYTNVEIMGLFNYTRNKYNFSAEEVCQNKNNKTKFKKKLSVLMPFFLKDIISLILFKRHIYPTKEEYSIKKENAELTENIIYVAVK